MGLFSNLFAPKKRAADFKWRGHTISPDVTLDSLPNLLTRFLMVYLTSESYKHLGSDKTLITARVGPVFLETLKDLLRSVPWLHDSKLTTTMRCEAIIDNWVHSHNVNKTEYQAIKAIVAEGYPIFSKNQSTLMSDTMDESRAARNESRKQWSDWLKKHPEDDRVVILGFFGESDFLLGFFLPN